MAVKTLSKKKELMGVSRKSLAKRIIEHKMLYAFIIPAAVLVFIFSYIPMYGATLAFKDYKYNLGILGSPWVGFKYFEKFLASSEFWITVKNTVVISSLKLIVNFPAPIILALLLNEMKMQRYKRVIQTVSYLPHFVSWVVVVSIMTAIFTPYGGVVNNIRKSMGLDAIFFMGEKDLFYPLIIFSEMWKGIGWGTILYLASIAGISAELYEAAICDGAGRMKCMWYITLPGLKNVIGIQFIFAAAGILGVNFEQILLLQQPANLEMSQVLDTYVLAMGIQRGQFGYATAIGLFRSVISFSLMMLVNFVVKKTSEVSVF